MPQLPPPPCAFPIPPGHSYWFGSPYGPRGSGFHNGWDLPAATGTPLVAVTAGTVSFAREDAGGIVANLDTVHGRFYYAHMHDTAGPSRRVTAGEVIGYVGSTGHSSGAHLHFSWFPAGAGTPAVNPLELLRYLEQHGTTTPPQTPGDDDMDTQELYDALAGKADASRTDALDALALHVSGAVNGRLRAEAFTAGVRNQWTESTFPVLTDVPTDADALRLALAIIREQRQALEALVAGLVHAGTLPAGFELPPLSVND